jgi:hypothetical protein
LAHSVMDILPVDRVSAEVACVLALPLALVWVNETTSNERVLPTDRGGCRDDRSSEEGDGETPRLLDGEGRCTPE